MRGVMVRFWYVLWLRFFPKLWGKGKPFNFFRVRGIFFGRRDWGNVAPFVYDKRLSRVLKIIFKSVEKLISRRYLLYNSILAGSTSLI